MFRLEGETLPPQTKGQILAYPIGRMYNQYAYPIQVGHTDVLAEAIAATGTPTQIKLSDFEIFALFPTSGEVQIDGERFSFSGKHATELWLTGIVRPGTMALHGLGASVTLVIPTHIYAVGENPGNHVIRAITGVRINGALKLAADPPTHTINLEDTTTVPGASVPTITFDLSSVPPEFTSPPGTGFSVQGTFGAWYPPWPLPNAAASTRSRYSALVERVRHWLRGWSWWQPLANEWGAISTSQPGVLTWTAPTLVEPPMAPTLDTSPTIIKTYPPPLLGTVTVDFEGLEDDDVGTITGTPNELIERPAHVTRLIMNEAYGAAGYDESVWAATHDEQVADGLVWALRFLPMPFQSFKTLVGLQGKADLFDSPDGWRYLYMKRRLPVYTFDARNTLGLVQVSTMPGTELVTVLQITYGADGGRAITLTDATGLERFGRRVGTLDFPWLPIIPVGAPSATYPTAAETKALAEFLGRFWLGQWSTPRLSVALQGTWDALHLELTDTVVVDAPLLATYGTIELQLRGRRLNLDDGHLDLAFAEAGVGISTPPEAPPAGGLFAGGGGAAAVYIPGFQTGAAVVMRR